MALIKYVGKKARRVDTVAGTKVVWNGPGDVQEVPDVAVSRLMMHPDVWAVADAAAPKAAEPAANKDAAPTGPKYLMQTDEGALVLDELDKDALRELAKVSGLDIHHKKSEEFFRQELANAFPVN